MPFDPIAHYYDIDDGRLTDDIPLYVGFAHKTGGPVLDLGVGSGRLAISVALSGYRVVGVDSSEQMLALARQRAQDAGLEDSITLIRADFRFLQMDESFPLIYCGYNAFLHLVESHEQVTALENWRRLLRPGGLLVMDVENPQLEALAALSAELEEEERLQDPLTDEVIVKYTAADVDLPDQILYLTRVYERSQADGNGLQHRADFAVRILFQRELALLLRCAGYGDLRFYGDYQLNPWEPDSPRLIAVAGV